MSTTDRTNPINYLSAAFNDPEKLLYEMGKFNMILCGSRAVDYFIPGSAIPESNWNFYCDSTKISIYGSLKALEKAGVMWYDLARAGTLAASQFKRKITVNDILPYARHLETCIDMPEKKWKNMKHDKAYELLTSIRNYESYETNGIGKIVGHTEKDGYCHYVELKFSTRDKNAMQLLMDFNLSALQCFIGFSGAGHLYYNTTVDKISYYWIDSRYDKKDPIIPKYKAKGFKIITYHDKEEVKPEIHDSLVYETKTKQYSNTEMMSGYDNVSSIRFLSDDKSKFVKFEKYYNIDRISQLMDKDGYYKLSQLDISDCRLIDILSQLQLGTLWYQLPWKPMLVPSIMDGMCTQLHMGFINYELIKSSMLQIAENSVFMDACAAKNITFSYPDNFLDKDLLKHIRSTLQFYGAME